jgi:hypothetical protein
VREAEEQSEAEDVVVMVTRATGGDLGESAIIFILLVLMQSSSMFFRNSRSNAWGFYLV